MRLSIILELLLIFLLIAFAAYGLVIEPRAIGISQPPALKQATENVNKYCTCNENICNCCREFHIPLVQLSGPGCASLQYLQDDKLAMQLSIGENILSSNLVNGKNPKPVCVSLPGGFSKFCGKIYSIQKEADKHFKACLGLELRSASEIEASLRVSCFRFGPDGLKLRPAEPLPAVLAESSSTTSDDDYEDLFGLGDDEDDDDDDDDDDDYEKVSPENNTVSTINEQQDQDQDEEDDEDDLLGFGALLDIFSGDDDTPINKKNKISTPSPLPSSFSIPILTLSSTPGKVTNESYVSKNPVTVSTLITGSFLNTNFDREKNSSITNINNEVVENSASNLVDKTIQKMTDNPANEDTTSIVDVDITSIENASNKIITNKMDTKIIGKVKVKKVKIENKKKASVTSQTANVINTDVTKPQELHEIVTVKDDLDDDYDYNNSEQDDEIENSSEELLTSEQDEKEEGDKNNKQVDKEEDDSQDEDEYEDDEEEDDEEDAVISALVDDDDENKEENSTINTHRKKLNKNVTDKVMTLKDDADYSYALTEILAKKQARSNLR